MKIIQIFIIDGLLAGLSDEGKVYTRDEKEHGWYWVELPTEFEAE